MTAAKQQALTKDVRSELAALPCATMNEWPLKWRFADPNYASLRPIHLQQIVPLAPDGARRLWEIIAHSRMHDALPFMSGFFERVEATHVGDSHDDAIDVRRIRKWLYQRELSFQTGVYLSWQSDLAAKTTWKMVVKYWSDLYYPISDDLTVIDGSFGWALLFWHEHEIFFGTNRRATRR